MENTQGIKLIEDFDYMIDSSDLERYPFISLIEDEWCKRKGWVYKKPLHRISLDQISEVNYRTLMRRGGYKIAWGRTDDGKVYEFRKYGLWTEKDLRDLKNLGVMDLGVSYDSIPEQFLIPQGSMPLTKSFTWGRKTTKAIVPLRLIAVIYKENSLETPNGGKKTRLDKRGFRLLNTLTKEIHDVDLDIALNSVRQGDIANANCFSTSDGNHYIFQDCTAEELPQLNFQGSCLANDKQLVIGYDPKSKKYTITDYSGIISTLPREWIIEEAKRDRVINLKVDHLGKLSLRMGIVTDNGYSARLSLTEL